MKTLGLTLAAGLMLAVAASESQAQVTIGNPFNGQGITISPNGVTPSGYGYGNGYGYNNGYGYGNRYGYSPSGYSYGNAYRVPGTNYYSSGYQAPGTVAPYQYNHGSYGAPSYGYPMNYGRAYTYPGTTTYTRGLFRGFRVR